MPLPHDVHEAAPAFENMPPAHAEQLREPGVEYLPPAQLSQLAAPLPEYLPPSQSSHSLAPDPDAVRRAQQLLPVLRENRVEMQRFGLQIVGRLTELQTSRALGWARDRVATTVP